MKEFFNTVQKTGVAEFKDRGSRFIAFVYPFHNREDFKVLMAGVKNEHPKATHYCFAYRIGLDGNNYRTGDDGEPSGTAGKPILGQIDSKELTNTLIIVVRYFGGSLLGVPGLINAYKTSASLVLQVTPVIQKPIELNYCLRFDYTMMNDIMLAVKQAHCTIISREMHLFCSMHIGIPVNREEQMLNRFGEIKNLEVEKLP